MVVDKKDISRLHRILGVLEGEGDGHRLAALTAATNILKANGKSWSDLADAAFGHHSICGKKLPNQEKSRSHTGPYAQPVRRRHQSHNNHSTVFTPGRRDIEVLDAIHDSGFLNAKLRFDGMTINVKIRNAGDANVIRMARHSVVTAYVDKDQTGWLVTNAQL